MTPEEIKVTLQKFEKWCVKSIFLALMQCEKFPGFQYIGDDIPEVRVVIDSKHTILLRVSSELEVKE